MTTTYLVRVHGKRPPFPTVAYFLWGSATDFDSDGNSSTAEDSSWTELTLTNREATNEQIDIDPVSEIPLVLKVVGSSKILAARAAFFLAKATEGEISIQLNGPYFSPTELKGEMGDFDTQIALRRATTVKKAL